MSGRPRNTKKLAQRIDLNYFKRLYPIPRWRRILTVALLGVAALWLGWDILGNQRRAFSAGPLSPSHARSTGDCAACHAGQTALGRKVTDAACLRCHDGPIHHTEQSFNPPCAECHFGHGGAFVAASIRSEACTQCHAGLKTKIASFGRGHPEFAALNTPDPGNIRMNHQLHMAENIRGPRGPVHLSCSDCHARENGRLMPIQFAKHCASCHLLPAEAPHDQPAVVAKFLANRGVALSPEVWKKMCEECHTMSFSLTAPPVVVPAQIPKKWFQHAFFDHGAHQKLVCADCHARALTSAVSADVLLPGIGACRTCHQASTCSECHVYHDWSKAKKIDR
jgi:hypothetical protein